MNDSQKITAHCMAAQAAGEEISDACARVIASQWHDGQAGPGYSFVSTGAFEDPANLWRELVPVEYHAGMSVDDKLAADMLGTYLVARYRANGYQPCGPVAGWSGLWL